MICMLSVLTVLPVTAEERSGLETNCPDGAEGADAPGNSAGTGMDEACVKAYTVMVYLCGGSLEKPALLEGGKAAFASGDVREMQASGFDEENVQVILLAGGTRDWYAGELPDGSAGLYRVRADALETIRNDRGGKKHGFGSCPFGIPVLWL